MNYQRISELKCSAVIVKTMEMHTGGSQMRVVVSGYPAINGDTILDKRNYVKENLDYIRKELMAEPRGHADMCGVILVTPDIKEVDVAALFMHNEG